MSEQLGRGRVFLVASMATLWWGGCGGATQVQQLPAVPSHAAEVQVVTNKTDGTVPELQARAENALLRQDYQAAILALEALRVAAPSAKVLLDLAFAYEAVQGFAKARACYQELAANFGQSPEAVLGLRRFANLSATTESWAELEGLAEQLLKAPGSDDMNKMTGLGARGLARVESGDETRAMRDIQDGLDLVESLHFGASGRLPVAAAQLKFALAEVRRVKSETLALESKDPEAFALRFEMRCAMLMQAQNAYTDAIRSEDPRWAAMSGFRIGAMYEKLHRDLMAMPPTKRADTKDKQALYFAIMHVRYRVLLEKGHDMMVRTIALEEKLGGTSTWLVQANKTKASIEQAIEDEKAALAKLPYTEEEVNKTLEILKRKVLERQEKQEQLDAKKRP
jgi:tetratricopeptide (TPR) repeat protein